MDKEIPGEENLWESLDKRPRDVLIFTYCYLQANEIPPTVREIRSGLNISSTSVVDYNLEKLEDFGLLKRVPKISRGIKFTNLFKEEIEPEVVKMISEQDSDK